MTSTHTVELTGANLIGSVDVKDCGTPFQATNPATGAQLEPVYSPADDAAVDRAASLAWEAFGTYRHASFEERAAFLETIAAEIEEIGAVLIDRVNAETGIPAARVQGELARTTGQLRMFASVVREGSWTGARLDTANPDRTPLPKPDLRQRQVPLGPVAVFSASNFPLAFSVAGGDTASALAAGAPVIVKAHSAHPGTSELVGRAIRTAVQKHDLPEGTFSLLFGSGQTVGIALVTDPRVRAVGFTGSRQAGVALTAAAAARPVPIPVYAEMSSINPVFVLPGALSDRAEQPGRDFIAAEQLGRDFIASMTTGTGQLCTSPGLVFLVDAPGADAFIRAATDAVAASAAAPMLYSGIASSFADGVARLAANDNIESVARADNGAAIACSGVPQLFVTTADQFLDDQHLQEEVFGPASVIVRVKEVGQVPELIDRLEGQLTATVHATESDHEAARELVDRLELIAGRVLFNGWPTGVEVGHAIVHGGPFPATSAPSTTSVGSRAVERFLRPVAYQNVPEELLAPELRTDNPLGIWRRIDGTLKLS
ncbi:aldehyde dehydrogenase (NADP(+)) [Rhodococcus marinonascens]|uniref:aldehyde dehydrogenase (NADP(+)) n=1 Tax=Rhodococcus marinonascens TaxID=38311 RepID=UPI000934202B|nr:aldehyde dehydrogenase (NADP(+)) [Rhodococcus marinonascens]